MFIEWSDFLHAKIKELTVKPIFYINLFVIIIIYIYDNITDRIIVRLDNPIVNLIKS